MKVDNPHPILVVDDEPQVRNLIATVLRDDGHEVEIADNGDEACRLLSMRSYDLVFLDLRMPKGNGLDVLRFLNSRKINTLGIIVTGFGSFDTAVEALRAGAFDYITKPLHLDEVKNIARRAIQSRQSRSSQTSFLPPASVPLKGNAEKSLVGDSQKMKELNALVERVAASDSTVLIRGESGTGKELVARALHNQSLRAEKPLVPVNCGAIPEELLESELFGHVRGSFTGAITDRMGRFLLANHGTIFLDEIGDMSPKLQVKILRVLQEHEIEPVGSTETIPVDVRVLAATNVNLEKAVAEKRFREDLYYRLNVIPIQIPSLRERTEDIPQLARYFIKWFNRKHANHHLDGFAPQTLAILKRHNWPGNVRELENLVERMTILSAHPMVQPDDLPERIVASASMAVHERPAVAALKPGSDGARAESGEGINHLERMSLFSGGELPALDDMDGDDEGGDGAFEMAGGVGVCGDSNLNDLVDHFERDLILKALERSRGIKNRAAQLLGIKRTTLVEKMKKKQISFSKNQVAD